MTDIINIPLNKLTVWTGNVRKTHNKAGIEELAASIKAHGLQQNLVVRKEGKKFAVVAGGSLRVWPSPTRSGSVMPFSVATPTDSRAVERASTRKGAAGFEMSNRTRPTREAATTASEPSMTTLRAESASVVMNPP